MKTHLPVYNQSLGRGTLIAQCAAGEIVFEFLSETALSTREIIMKVNKGGNGDEKWGLEKTNIFFYLKHSRDL